MVGDVSGRIYLSLEVSLVKGSLVGYIFGWIYLSLEVSLVGGEGQGAARRSKEGHGRMVCFVLYYTFSIDAQCIYINPKQY